VKTKDLDPKAKAKDSRYQDQIFHRSSYILSDIFARCGRMISPMIEKTLSTGAELAGTARIVSNEYPWAQIPYHKD